MKKIVGLVVVLAMIMAMIPSVFAVEGDAMVPGDSTTITIPVGESVEVNVSADSNVKVSASGGFRFTNWHMECETLDDPIYPNRFGTAEMVLDAGNHTVKFVNDGEEELAIDVSVSAIVPGTWDCPAELVVPGEVTVEGVPLVDGGYGYYCTWIADVSGELTVTLDCDGAGWMYSLSNWTSFIFGETHYSDDPVVVNSETITVSEGDEIVLDIAAYDPDGGVVGAANCNFTITTSVTGASAPTVDGTLNLGENVLNLDLDDMDGVSYSYTATEDCALIIEAIAVSHYDAELGEWVEDSPRMAFGWSIYNLYINGEYYMEPSGFANLSAGDSVIVTVNSSYGWESKVTLQLSYAVEGSQANPKDAISFPYGEYGNTFLMNAALEAGNTDGFWWTFTADKSGILVVENAANMVDAEGNPVPATDFDVFIYYGEYDSYYNMDEGHSNPVVGFPVQAGDVFKVWVSSFWGDAMTIYVSASIVEGSIAEPILIKSNDFIRVPVTSNTGVALKPNSEMWAGYGLTVSSPVAGEAVVEIYNSDGTLYGTFRDLNGDGEIQINLPGGYYDRPTIVVKNNAVSEWYAGHYFNLTSGELFDTDEMVVEHVHNIVHVDAVDPGCHMTGNVEHWYCTECETVWADEALTQVTNHMNVIVPAIGGEVVHVEAVDPGCHMTGNIEHWYCTECGLVWQDAALTQITNHMNVILPALGGEVVHVEAVAPGCHMTGNIEHWYCEDCGLVWQDEALTQITNHMNVILPAVGGELIHVEAVAPGCHMTGNIEHWYCTGCEVVWADEALTQVTNHMNVILPAVGGDVIHVPAVDATCASEGNIEHWYCEDCGQVWQDEALTQLTNHKNVIIPTTDHDLVHVDAVNPGCHMTGNIEHWYCKNCETVWADEALTQITNHMSVILPATGGNLIHVEAVAPGCHMTGNIEHWYCTECEVVWADEALTQVTNHMNVILPAVGGDVIHVPAVDATCASEGNIEHWYCESCEQVWQDEALTQLTNHKNVIIPTTDHDLVHVDAVTPGCHMTGNIEHWYCKNCETVWADEALTQITNHMSVILPATGGEVIHVPAVDPTCSSEGNIEHWYCETCELVWQDAALTQITNHKNVILPAADHDLVHVEAVNPGCHMTGNIEHWYCKNCETVWADEALTQITNHMSVILPATGGNVVHIEAVEPGCHMTGNIEHWYCTECEVVWADEALTQITNHKNVILPATGGDVIHVEAKAPTCTENGNIEHWYCEKCELVWQDEALTQITNHKNVIVAAAHNFVNGTCSVCGKEDDSNAETGDMISAVVAAIVVSAASIVALPIAKKKFF